jgi:hypothetical protein
MGVGRYMRYVEREARFEGAFYVGNGFGYFEYSDMEASLASVSRALKPEARFVVGPGLPLYFAKSEGADLASGRRQPLRY